MKEPEEFTEQQGDTHSIGLFRVQWQMRVCAFRLDHALRREGVLEARAGKEPTLVAVVKPCRDIWCSVL